MRKPLCAAIGSLLLLAPMMAVPAIPTVIASTRQRIQAMDERATGHLVQVDANGSRKSYKFSLKAHWFADGLRLLCEITSPASARVRLLLHMDLDGRTTIQGAHPDPAHPGAQIVGVLPFERWTDGLLGTGFSYEDLAEGQFFWQNQLLLQPVKYGARDCFVIQSTPGPDDRTHYASVISYIDQQTNYPVHVSKKERSSGVLKEYIYYGLRQSSGVWSATQIEVKTADRPGSSLLIIDRGSAKAKLGRKDFDLNLPSTPEEN